MSVHSKGIHEKYHKKTKHSRKIIKESNFTYHLIIEVVNSYIKTGVKEILDIGCGAGSLSFYLANKQHKVTGVDISQKAIDECIKTSKILKIENVRFIRNDFPENYNLRKKYDMVIFTEVIEHIEYDRLAIKKINRILKSSGILILSTPSIDAPLHRLGLTQKFDKEVGHLRRYSLQSLKKLLIDNGFSIVRIKKTEGIVRNFLFVNPIAGKLVRFINFYGSDYVNFIDRIALKLFGESNFIIVAKKK